MVENKTRKIEREEIVVCEVCNNAIPKDLLEKSAGGIKNLYCQYCGVSLNITYDLIDNNVIGESPFISSNAQKESNLMNIQQNSQESNLALSYSNIKNALRRHFFQLIYQLLKSTPLTQRKIQNKKELKSSHINIILKKLWKELKDLNSNDLANQELISSKRRIKEYFDKFQSSLRPYKKFRKINFALFAENIEFVFGLILGDYEFSNLTTSKKRIVLDLKKSFGFKSDTATTNSFTYNISLIISKKIHSILNEYHITEGNDNKLALDEIIGYVIDYTVNGKVKSSDLCELSNSKKKKFYAKLEILIKNVKTDWIYCKSFEDHIYKLIIIVNSLISDEDYSSYLIGFERLICQGLKQSALFEKDHDFSPHFKLNLTLILCRVIYQKIKNPPGITKLNSRLAKLGITDEIKIKNSILDEITAGKKINSQILKTFYKLSLEEFQTDYEKLQHKLTSDLIYVESFRDYLSDLVRLVFNIVHLISKKSHLTQLELALIKDLANYNFEWFNKKQDRTYFYYPSQNIREKSNVNTTGMTKTDKTSTSDTYSTLELIEDLRYEFQLLSEELSLIFPERLVQKRGNAYSNRFLSQLWGLSINYINALVYKIKQGSDFVISKEALLQLQERLEERLGAKALGCFSIIKKYQDNKITLLKFVDILEKELGRVSGEIQVTDKELGLILGGTYGFIKGILRRMKTPTFFDYNQSYKFSKERLGEFKAYLYEIFGSRAKKCFELLNRYETLNPDLKEYSKQQYTINKPNYFKNIEENPEASYWFGFLRADGSRSGAPYQLTIELSAKDTDHLKQFAKVIGFPLDRITFRTRFKWYKRELKGYEAARVKFSCKPMANDIDKLGFQSSKAEQKFIPNYVIQTLKKANKMAKQTNIDWWLTTPGKVGLAFLLGFFDGDGHYAGSRYAEICSSSKNFLEHTKELFEIKNKVVTGVAHGEEAWCFDQKYVSVGLYTLTLGPKLYDKMINSYLDSMKRKRP